MPITDPAARERIIQITVEIVNGQITAGLIDPTNDLQLRRATRTAVETAKAAYFAAVEFVS